MIYFLYKKRGVFIMRFLLFIFIFVSSVTYGRSYNVLYPLSEDEVLSASSMASAKEEGLRTLSEDAEATEATKEERLFDAVRSNNLEEVQKLLKEGADLNAVDKGGRTLLYSVTSSEVAKALIDAGADPKVRDAHGITPLHRVANSGVAKVLIAAGADLNAKDRAFFGDTPLHDAVMDARVDVVIAKVLIDAGANPNAKNKNDNTPLHYARDAETAKILLAAGANPNVKNRYGYTPLRLAKDLGIVEALLAAGADPNVADKEGYAPLHDATDAKVTAALLAAGADPKAKTETGHTPLIGAKDSGAVEALLVAGADPNAKTNLGRAPLHGVEFQAAKLLIDAGVDINVVDDYLYTPLHFAVVGDVRKQAEFLLKNDVNLSAEKAVDEVIRQVEILLENVADPNARAKLSEFKLTKLLLDKGADPNAKDKAGRTPFRLLTEYAKGIQIDLSEACRGAFNK